MRSLGILTCREFTLIATDYLEARLSAWSRLHSWLHLGWCRPCQAYLRQLRQTIATLGRLPGGGPTGPAREALLQNFRESHGSEAPSGS